MKRVTISDIALKSGFSIKTVSRVLNGSKSVKQDTRDKILSVIEEEGYSANQMARSLKGVSSKIIVVFIDRHNGEYLSIWHNIMLKYLFIYARQEGMKIVVSPSSSERFEEDETDGFYLVANGIAEGAILLENILDDDRVRYFEKNGIPYVVFGEPENENVPVVCLDNYDLGYKGGKFLSGKGYKHIALSIGDLKFLSTKKRIDGFRMAMMESHCQYEIYDGIDTPEKAYQKAKEVLAIEPVPEAFFVSGDERALGVYRAIYEKGLSIPKDIAVLGIDNIDIGNYYYPPISTVGQDFQHMAEGCINYVMQQIEDQKKGIRIQKRRYNYPCQVIERDST